MFLFQISRRTLITKVSRSICLTNSIAELKYFFQVLKLEIANQQKGHLHSLRFNRLKMSKRLD